MAGSVAGAVADAVAVTMADPRTNRDYRCSSRRNWLGQCVVAVIVFAVVIWL